MISATCFWCSTMASNEMPSIGFGGSVDLIDILARQEALRNDDSKIVRPDGQSRRKHHRGQLMPKHDLKTTVISLLEPHLHGLSEVVEPAVFYVVVRFQEAAAKHRSERQGHEA